MTARDYRLEQEGKQEQTAHPRDRDREAAERVGWVMNTEVHPRERDQAGEERCRHEGRG